jgi:hypothetical protein
MAITYTWSITSLKTAPALEGLSDVVTGIRFNYTGTDENGNTHTFNGAVPVGAPDSENFKALAELTEAEVIAWAQANHPTDHMNSVIERAIAKQVAPTDVEVSLPWAPALETPASGSLPE